MPCAETCFGFGRPGPRVLLQHPVGVLAPACALADQLDLGRALAHHQRFDERRERRHGAAGCRAQRRPRVAEDAWIAVAVRRDLPQAEALEDAREDVHRVLEPWVLRIRLDPLEVGLRADSLDLELGHEDHQLARRAADERHGTFGGQEAEAGEVLDVLLVEEHVAVELLLGDLLEQKLSADVQLVRVNPGLHADDFTRSRRRPLPAPAAARAVVVPLPATAGRAPCAPSPASTSWLCPSAASATARAGRGSPSRRR